MWFFRPGSCGADIRRPPRKDAELRRREWLASARPATGSRRECRHGPGVPRADRTRRGAFRAVLCWRPRSGRYPQGAESRLAGEVQADAGEVASGSNGREVHDQAPAQLPFWRAHTDRGGIEPGHPLPPVLHGGGRGEALLERWARVLSREGIGSAGLNADFDDIMEHTTLISALVVEELEPQSAEIIQLTPPFQLLATVAALRESPADRVLLQSFQQRPAAAAVQLLEKKLVQRA